MLLPLINKDETQYLDLSIFINCSPERILFYYYNSCIRITFNTYQQMKAWPQEDDTPHSCLNQWLELLEKEIGLEKDLNILKESPFVESLGPYYFGPTNTQFVIDKVDKDEKECISSVDFGVLFNQHKRIDVDKELQRYFKSRKNPKKTTLGMEATIKDLSMCLAAIEQIERINRHIKYLQVLIKHRSHLLGQEDLAPLAPAPRPERPQKPEEPDLSFSSIRALSISRTKQKQYQNECTAFGHNLKIYFVKYREFEKASERYKRALTEWTLYENHLIERCLDDIADAENKLESVRVLLEIYEYILQKSYVHPDYHDQQTLSSFKYYLQTGRADDLQACMNLYEEEQHWSEIKASQQRIENTIHFLQAEPDFTSFSNKLSVKMIAASNEPLG